MSAGTFVDPAMITTIVIITQEDYDTMSHTITLTGDQGYSYYSQSGLDADTTIDAYGATWHLNQQMNPYPFRVTSSGTGLKVLGGTVVGEVPLDTDWQIQYINSAAVRISSNFDFLVKDWTISQVWDGIRVVGTGTFTIEDVWVKSSRDDAVENDDVLGGTIRDSLFENVFSGVSLGDGDVNGSGNVVTMDGVLIRMESYLAEGKITHGSPFKLDKGTGADDVVPGLRFFNNVVAIDTPNHESWERLQRAWDKTIEASGNVFLNLSDTPLPTNYPKPGAGWTILEGQAARDYWQQSRDVWIDNHGIPTTPPIEPPPSINTIEGTSRADMLSGTSGVDAIYGYDGNDILSGGTGRDIFVFDTTLNGNTNVDAIIDFNVADDSVYMDNAVFTKLGSGSLTSPKTVSSSYFTVGDKAKDSNDYIVYDKVTGSLSYDADGSKSGAAVEIAKLAPNLGLTYNDFYIV
jgi:Ca2+-binding RTX toxin-like protein